jgi:predicted acetyltransferase
MVNDYPEFKIETNYCMSEFFVMYKYRKMGIGTYAANKIFDKFKGKWQLKRHPKNEASVKFWNKVIAEYTKGKYELKKSWPEAIYADGTYADIFIFET